MTMPYPEPGDGRTMVALWWLYACLFWGLIPATLIGIPLAWWLL